MTARFALFGLLTLLLTAGLAWLTIRTNQLLRVWRPPDNPLLDPADAALHVLLCLLCVALGLLSGVSPAQLGWQVTSPALDVTLGVIAGLALAALFAVSTRAVVKLWGDRFYSPLVADLVRPRTRREVPLVALAMIPSVLLEELLFRSLWIGGFGVILPAVGLVLVAAAIFGSMHSPQGWWGMAGATLAGLILGALFLWAGGLLMPIVAHYVTNMAQILAAPSSATAPAPASSADSPDSAAGGGAGVR